MERIKFFFQVETEIRAEVSWWWRWPGWWWPWWCTSCGPTAWEASLRASHRVRFLEPLIVKLLVIKLIVCAILNWLFTAQCISYMAHSWLSYNWNTCEIVGSGKLDNWKITLVPNIREASCLFMCHIYWEKLRDNFQNMAGSGGFAPILLSKGIVNVCIYFHIWATLSEFELPINWIQCSFKTCFPFDCQWLWNLITPARPIHLPSGNMMACD